jgi:hypothetical protein
VASSPLSAAGFQPAEDRRRGFGSLVLLFLLPAAIFGGLVAYGHFKPTKAATPQQGTPGSLVWGDGKVIFSNKQQLTAWLRLHGSSYSAFVKRHPEALRLVTARPRKHVAAKVAARPTKATKATKTVKATAKPRPTVTVVTHQAAPRPAATGKPGRTSIPVSSRTLVFSISAALGLLLGVFALLPPLFVRRFGLRSSPERQRELRFSAAAVSVAILAGVGFAVLMG